MSTLQDRRAPIDFQIVRELVSLIPENWSIAQMDVQRRERHGAGEEFEIEISSPEGKGPPVVPSDDIYPLLFALADVFREHGRVWARVSYIVSKAPDQGWKFKASFSY